MTVNQMQRQRQGPTSASTDSQDSTPSCNSLYIHKKRGSHRLKFSVTFKSKESYQPKLLHDEESSGTERSLRGRLCTPVLLLRASFLLESLESGIEILCCKDPQSDDSEKDESQVWCGSGQRSESDNHKLLNQGTSGFSKWVANDINCSLTLCSGLIIQWDVCHLLAWIEEGVLGSLGEDVLGSSYKHSGKQWGETQGSQCWSEWSREEHQREEDNSSCQKDSWGDQCSNSPSKLVEDPARYNHHGECDSSSSSREVSHEGGVVIWIRELFLNLGLPCHLDQVDGDTVCYHEEGEIANVWGGGQEPEGLSDRHWLLLLLLLLWQRSLHLWHHSLLEVCMDSTDDEPSNHNHSHESLEGKSPSVNSFWEVGSNLRENLDSTSREDQSDVCSQSEQWVELLGLINSGNLVGKSPEKHRHNNRSPELCHNIEKAVGPVADNSDWSGETSSHGVQQILAQGCWMKHITDWIEHKGKSSEESNEWDNACVEELLVGQHIGQLGVQHSEPNGHWKVHPCLQEGNNLSTGTWCSHNQHILGISQNGVVEQDAEEHHSERNDLLPCECWNSQEFLLIRGSSHHSWDRRLGNSLDRGGHTWLGNLWLDKRWLQKVHKDQW